MIDLTDALVEGITKIANHERIIKECEPGVCYHRTLTTHDTKRVLYSLIMLVERWKSRNG